MNRPEEALQRSVVAYLRAACPDLLWFAVPNGGYRTKAEAGIMKAMGQRAGVADLCLVLDGGRAAFIELKAPTGRPSPAQRIFEDDALRSGALHLTCRSLAEVEGALKAWGVKLRARGQ